jgi:hypothetical protein
VGGVGGHAGDGYAQLLCDPEGKGDKCSSAGGRLVGRERYWEREVLGERGVGRERCWEGEVLGSVGYSRGGMPRRVTTVRH